MLYIVLTKCQFCDLVPSWATCWRNNPRVFECSDGKRFHFKGCVSSQKNSYCSLQNPMLIHEFPLHGLKVGTWCAMSKLGLLGLLLVHELINSHWYVTYSVTILWTNVQLQGNICPSFSAKYVNSSHRKHFSVFLAECFWWENNNRGFWPQISP
jgi:hypothetical protein